MTLSSLFRRAALVAGLAATTGGSKEKPPANKTLATTITGYGVELQAQQEKFTSMLRQLPLHRDTQVVFLDPATFNTARAEGLMPREALRVMLERKGITIANTTLADMADIMEEPYLSPVTGDLLTMMPALSINGQNNGSKTCLVVPLDPADPTQISGLTRTELEAFAQDHEGWHCLFTYPLSPSISVLETTILHENFATLGAAGEMLRRSYPLGVLDTLIAWQESRAYDLEHYAAPALRQFKKTIKIIGLDKFISMPIADLQELYYSLSLLHAPSAQKVQFIHDYHQATPEERQEMEKAAAKKPKLTEAINFYRQKVIPSWERDSLARIPDPAAVAAARAALKNWDARRTLREKAQEDDSAVTSASLIRAHTGLQDNLHAQRRQEPENLLHPEQMWLLKKALSAEIAALKKPRAPAPEVP